MVAIATTRFCGGVDHIPVIITVSTRLVSLMFERSSVFPREEVPCIIGPCRGHFHYFEALTYQTTRMSGDPAVKSNKLCRLIMISRSVIFNTLR